MECPSVEIGTFPFKAVPFAAIKKRIRAGPPLRIEPNRTVQTSYSLITQQSSIVDQLRQVILQFPHSLFDEIETIVGPVPKAERFCFGELWQHTLSYLFCQLEMELSERFESKIQSVMQIIRHIVNISLVDNVVIVAMIAGNLEDVALSVIDDVVCVVIGLHLWQLSIITHSAPIDPHLPNPSLQNVQGVLITVAGYCCQVKYQLVLSYLIDNRLCRTSIRTNASTSR